jgi:hypothetical protein
MRSASATEVPPNFMTTVSELVTVTVWNLRGEGASGRPGEGH